MDEIIPNLWIGGLLSALDTETLKQHRIFSVLTAMRGKVTVHHTFMRHQISLDDSSDADILIHLPPAIQFIEKELDKGRGVLVHCQAGISRSATIVAAYLMYSQDIGTSEALRIIREKRPIVDPNENFLRQLEIFYTSKGNITPKSKPVRLFYMEKAKDEIMNGDGSSLGTDMFAKYPRTPSNSVPPTPAIPRRRIRCKMCRHELATREHMIDHGQLGPPTPAILIPIENLQPPIGSTSIPLPPLPDAMTAVVDPARPKERINSQTDPSSGGHPESKNGGQEARHTGDRITRSNNVPPTSTDQGPPQPPSQYATSTNLSAALMANPTLAALRSLHTSPSPATSSSMAPPPANSISPPILINPKCSGYFVEPMKWMDAFLSKGELAGKIVCPNQKCGAKLGNYDWAGLCCGCKQWVTPGFCINRSKVDEVV